MLENQSKPLTQAALVTALKNQGYVDINERSIAEWRRHELLPQFDYKGRGLGRGAGKQPGAWSQAETVLQQAAWVHDLLRVYERFDAVYLPLWMLGYSVPVNLVKESLRRPFNQIDESIREEFEAEKLRSQELQREMDFALEDLIHQAVYDSLKKAKQLDITGANLSPVLFDALLNLFFNEDYDLQDLPFQRTVKALKLRETRRGSRSQFPLSESVETIFECAPFIKEHFSFQRLKKAVRYCTGDVFNAVEHDLEILREITFCCTRMFKALFAEAPAEFKDHFSDGWHVFFTFGKVFVWLDMAVRRDGFGDWVDHILSQALHHVREECNESKESELRAASAQFVSSVQAKTEEWAQEWLQKNAGIAGLNNVQGAMIAAP